MGKLKIKRTEGPDRLDWVIRGILGDLPEPASWIEVHHRLDARDLAEIKELMESQEATSVLMYLRRMVEGGSAEEAQDGKFARTYGDSFGRAPR